MSYILYNPGCRLCLAIAQRGSQKGEFVWRGNLAFAVEFDSRRDIKKIVKKFYEQKNTQVIQLPDDIEKQKKLAIKLQLRFKAPYLDDIPPLEEFHLPERYIEKIYTQKEFMKIVGLDRRSIYRYKDIINACMKIPNKNPRGGRPTNGYPTELVLKCFRQRLAHKYSRTHNVRKKFQEWIEDISI